MTSSSLRDEPYEKYYKSVDISHICRKLDKCFISNTIYLAFLGYYDFSCHFVDLLKFLAGVLVRFRRLRPNTDEWMEIIGICLVKGTEAARLLFISQHWSAAREKNHH